MTNLASYKLTWEIRFINLIYLIEYDSCKLRHLLLNKYIHGIYGDFYLPIAIKNIYKLVKRRLGDNDMSLQAFTIHSYCIFRFDLNFVVETK